MFSLEYGPSLIEHVLVKRGILNSAKIDKTFDINQNIDKVVDAMSEAYTIFKNAQNEPSKV